jgi:hypothetical protein
MSPESLNISIAIALPPQFSQSERAKGRAASLNQ